MRTVDSASGYAYALHAPRHLRSLAKYERLVGVGERKRASSDAGAVGT
jgi:hypothetical protein